MTGPPASTPAPSGCTVVWLSRSAASSTDTRISRAGRACGPSLPGASPAAASAPLAFGSASSSSWDGKAGASVKQGRAGLPPTGRGHTPQRPEPGRQVTCCCLSSSCSRSHSWGLSEPSPSPPGASAPAAPARLAGLGLSACAATAGRLPSHQPSQPPDAAGPGGSGAAVTPPARGVAASAPPDAPCRCCAMTLACASRLREYKAPASVPCLSRGPPQALGTRPT
jgi:hypothetical protein